MRFPMTLLVGVACLVQAPTGDPVEIPVQGTVWAAPSGGLRLAMTADPGNFQENPIPVPAAQLNRSERCGERLTVERAVLAPAEPPGVPTASVHYGRFACAKALGKEVVKRLAGGNRMLEAALTQLLGENGMAPPAEVRKIDADGSLGELLRSGPFGDSRREKTAASIESAVRKPANLKSTLPAEMESAASMQSGRFADGGAGGLWLTMSGEVRLGAEQFRDAAKKPARRWAEEPLARPARSPHPASAILNRYEDRFRGTRADGFRHGAEPASRRTPVDGV
jgi:hypothetical protein